MTGLEGATAIVTGAAMGIGRAAAEELGRRGAWVLICDIDESESRETLRLVRQAGGDGDICPTDVAEVAQLRGAVDMAVGARGRLDVMVNNAGIPMAVEIEDMTEELWQRVIDVNLKGMFFGCKLAIEQMLEQGGGAIVNLASAMGLVAGLPNQPAYIASKGGTVLLTKALAIDFATRGIRVNCVCPCVTDTPMLGKFLATQHSSDEERAAARARLESIEPHGRMCTPAEVAHAIAFLASPLASGITGVALPVDGGFVAR